MMLNCAQMREIFRDKLAAEEFTIDKTGCKTIEIIGASFLADEEAIFGTPSKEYIDAEIKWYESMSTNVNDIPYPNGVPGAWKHAANEHGETNSNYGYLIFSDTYHYQYENVLEELKSNPDGRRATMVYNRPSIWVDYNDQGKNDFICTNAVSYYVRDNQLHAVVQMRSNDVVFGYKNDKAWGQYVLDKLVADIADENLTAGQIIWQVQNLHVYERHFEMVK
mgnify:FL=1